MLEYVRMIDNEIAEIFSRGVASCIDPGDAFKKKVQDKKSGASKKDVVIKIGVDPTRPDIHLGHAVILRKLRAFQDLGCKIVFLVGDFTSMIGDPTGKSKVRPEISQQEVEANMQTYLEQVGKILRTEPEVFSWIRNSDWLYSLEDIIAGPQTIVFENNNKKTEVDFPENSLFAKAKIYQDTRMQQAVHPDGQITNISLRGFLWTLRNITHSRLIERDMFQERIKNGEELYMHEMMYPVLQGIDSKVIADIYGSCDLEIGGTDQTFNMLMGRDVMKMNKQDEQSVMSLDILVGLDGKEKMSKSLDNYIGITDAPNYMYGKVMSIPDSALKSYFTLATPISENEIDTILKGHPKEAKMHLAKVITEIYHGKEKADEAEKAFTDTFAKGFIPEDVFEWKGESDTTILDMLIGAEIATSKTDARRLVEQGAVTFLDTETKIDDSSAVAQNGTYRVGKHRFVKKV